MRYGILLTLCALFACATTRAQDTLAKNNKDLSDLSIDELMDLDVFVASKKLQKLIESPTLVSIITKRDIQDYGTVTLVDILKHQPGIEVFIDPRGEYELAIRGVQKKGNVLFLINGQHFNDFYDGGAILDLPVDIIERIEIIRGPGSSLYGSNAMIGVVSITTVSDRQIVLNGGVNGMVTGAASYNVDLGENIELSAFAGLSRNTTVNSTLLQDKTNGEDWSLTTDGFETTRSNLDFTGGINLQIEKFKLDVFNFNRDRGMYAGPLFFATDGSKVKQNRFLTSMEYQYAVANNVIITPKVYYNRINSNTFLQELPTGYVSPVSGDTFVEGRNSIEKYQGESYGAQLDFYIRANDYLEITTGSVFEDLRLSQYSFNRNYDAITDNYYSSYGNYNDIPLTQLDKFRYVFAYFLNVNYTQKKLSVNAGLRYDDYNDFGQSFNPRLGITYHVTSRFRIKGTAAKAFRAPTFKELYDNTSIGNEYGILGNPELKPENIKTYELSFEYNFSKFFIKYNLYHFKNTSLIRTYDPHGGGSIGEYLNIGDVSFYGNEAELIYTPWKLLNFRINYAQFITKFSWNEDEVNKSSVVFLNNQESFNRELRNIPTVRINAGAQLCLNKVKVMVSMNYGNSSENNNRFYLEKDHYARIPYYVQMNVNIQYLLSNKLNLSLMANGIGTKYSAPDESTNIDAFGPKGLIQPGPMISMKLKYNL